MKNMRVCSKEENLKITLKKESRNELKFLFLKESEFSMSFINVLLSFIPVIALKALTRLIRVCLSWFEHTGVELTWGSKIIIL